METPRSLLVIADDFGIGPETSRGILELAVRGVVTGTVLLLNSPYAESAMGAWERTRWKGEPLEVGWHPCLTLDRPVSPPTWVPSLVDSEGRFHSLGRFLRRLCLGQIRSADIAMELRAQLDRFTQLVGHPPGLVNSHQHVSLFPPVGRILRTVLAEAGLRPYVRRVREPWSLLAAIPGARRKRLLLSLLGRLESSRLHQSGFPGQDWLAGITDPPWLRNADFFVRWLGLLPGQDVELGCHPGHYDPTLLGRDAHPGDGLVQRRIDEYNLLAHPSFLEACQHGRFNLVSPRNWLIARQGVSHAA